MPKYSFKGNAEEKEAKVLVAKVDNTKAKLKYRWRRSNIKVLCGINTSLPNGIIYEAIKEKKVLNHLNEIKTEVKYGKNSRVEFL